MRPKWQNLFARYQTPWLVMIYLANYPLLYAMNVLFSRELGAADYGNFAAARSVGALGATLALFGLDKACLQFLPMYRARGEVSTAKGFIYFATAMVLLLGASLSIGGYLLFAFIQTHWGTDEHPALHAMLLIAPMSCVGFLVKLSASQAKALSAAFVNQIVLPAATIGLLAVVFIFRHQLTDFLAIDLLLVGYALVLILLLVSFRSIWRSNYQNLQTDMHGREWLYSSSALLITALVFTGLGQSGTLVLELFHADETTVGLFAAVKQVALLPLLVLAALNLVAAPEIALLMGQGNYAAATARLGFYLRILIGVGVAALAASILWGQAMLMLFDNSFKDGHMALIILSAGYLISLVGGLSIPILQVLQANRFIYTSMLGLLALNLALALALAPIWGPTGVASAYALSVLTIYSWQIYWLRKNSDIDYLASIATTQPPF